MRAAARVRAAVARAVAQVAARAAPPQAAGRVAQREAQRGARQAGAAGWSRVPIDERRRLWQQSKLAGYLLHRTHKMLGL